MNALLLTDQREDESVLAHALRLAGLSVSIGHDLKMMLAKPVEHPPDLLLVALRLSDPLLAVHELRRVAICPLIIVTERISEDLHVTMVDAGADWVIERPYNIRLLIAYTHALLRRSSTVSRVARPILQYETVKLDPAKRTVRVRGRLPQRLSQLESRLLQTLLEHQGQVLPTETIVEHVWGYTGDGDRSLVRGLINRLRAKIEQSPNAPKYIRTIPGVGYSFGDSDEEV